MNFFAELRRRNVFRVGIFYIVSGWLVLQIGDVLFELLGVPDWMLKFVFGVLLLGFPFALFLSWAYELTPEGIKRESEVDRSASIAPQTGKRLDRLIIVVMALVIVALVAERWIGPGETLPAGFEEEKAERSQNGGTPSAGSEGDRATSWSVPDGRTAEGDGAGIVAIAVLPFVNMSSDPEQEYFSDGMTEELLNTLVKVDGILVAARTSVFSYKDQDKDVRVIGEELGVDHIIEGSVRKSGNDLRITAQLVRVSDGFHLWSETYDRKLENVFAIQEEIATEVAQALQAPLGLGSSLVTNRTENIENYDLYLEGRQLLRARRLEPAIDIFREVVLKEPDFAPAWANLAIALYTLPGYQDTLGGEPTDLRELSEQSLRAARRAVELAPDLPEAHHALGNVLRGIGKWSEARQSFRQALVLDPSSIEILEDWRQFQAETGHIQAAIATAERGYRLEPQSALAIMAYADSLYIGRRYDRSVELTLEAIARNPEFIWPSYVLTEIALIRGDYVDALRIYEDCVGCQGFSWSDAEMEVLRALVEGREPSVDREKLLDSQQGQLVFEAGGMDLVLDVMARNARRLSEGESVFLVTFFNNPYMDELRKTPRYKQIVRDYGLPDYWREHGWPDYCEPVGEDDFECGAYQPE